MIQNKSLSGLLAVLVVVITGCAPAYHCYQTCNVDCGYCPPPPLPYTQYDGCVCHSCAVSSYLSKWSPPANEMTPVTPSAESRDGQPTSP